MDRLTSNDTLLRIVSEFELDGRPVSIRPVGNGHINDTYLALTDRDRKYILQRINDKVFRSPRQLMENIAKVSEFLILHKSNADEFRMNASTDPLRFLSTKSGSLLHESADGYWRVMTYVDNSYACEQVSDAEEFCEIGRAYGAFINDLAGFPAEELHETIERFHDTRWRLDNLLRACEADPAGRKRSALDEIRFAVEHEEDVDILNDCLIRGELSLRVTHNDTKINNVLMSRDTGRALCVIDLDTVMPGLAVNDFGDAIRSGAATGREDEMDLDKVRLDLELYEAFRRGFVDGCPDLTCREIEMLPVGAKLMTLECGIRFLTDYLEGDSYFKTDYEEHNLVRCRTQFRLVRDMEEKWEQMVNYDR